MWAEVDGERKKVACGPCIRGHRSSKCDHRDRVLVEVRKPGRPLSSCPHPTGSCSCERVVINYTIPKASECACPSDRSQPQQVAAIAGSNRVQKNRRKSTINVAAVERALKASLDGETDSNSIYTRTSTDSNEASPPSSASSTPRILPNGNETSSSCCHTKPVEPLAQPPMRQGSCCGSKAKAIPEPAPVKSCCCGPKRQTSSTPDTQLQSQITPTLGKQFQFKIQPQMHTQHPQFTNMHSQVSPPASFLFSLGHPIYNHSAAAYQGASSIPMTSVNNGSMSPHSSGPQNGHSAPEHNCHCGESCSCFGCAAHPNNATMMEYVRLMAQFQYTGGFGSMPPPLYDMPTYPHHPGYGAEAHQPMNPNTMNPGFSATTPTQMNFHHASLSMSSIPPAQPPPMANTWHQTPVSDPAHTMAQTQTQLLEPNNYMSQTPTTTATIEHPLNLKPEEVAPTPASADSPNDNSNAETPTLSPTSYFWNQMVLPNCSDATGTCQCEDGCECVGCLTHGGHNGVLLAEAPELSGGLADFGDFGADAGLALGDETSFLFGEASTGQ